MSQKFQVMRNGAVIGQHDEPTLAALLNAGALRLSDTYWHRSMGAPRTLAEFLCTRPSKRRWVRRLAVAGVVVAGLGLSAIGWQRLSKSVPGKLQIVTKAKKLDDGLGGYEIRRGQAVMLGSFEASLNDEPPFPQAAVEALAAHSRVAVLTLDAQGLPRGVSAGFVAGDGSQVVCSLAAISNADGIELRLVDGTTSRPTSVIIDQDSGVAVLPLPHSSVPLRVAQEPLSNHERALVVSHALSARSEGRVARVMATQPGEKRILYKMDQRLPSSSAGSPVLNAAGDVAAVIVDAGQGTALRAGDALNVMKTGKAQSLSALKGKVMQMRPALVEVSATSVSGGNLIASLRNTSGLPIHGALLHVSYFNTPPEVEESRKLEARLRELAVEAGQIEDESSDAARANRQALREVNAQIESAQKRLEAAIANASQRSPRQDFHIVQCDLQPGIPQILEIEVDASTHWSARVVVLDVDS